VKVLCHRYLQLWISHRAWLRTFTGELVYQYDTLAHIIEVEQLGEQRQKRLSALIHWMTSRGCCLLMFVQFSQLLSLASSNHHDHMSNTSRYR
jgi:hypothetical protein